MIIQEIKDCKVKLELNFTESGVWLNFWNYKGGDVNVRIATSGQLLQSKYNELDELETTDEITLSDFIAQVQEGVKKWYEPSHDRKAFRIGEEDYIIVAATSEDVAWQSVRKEYGDEFDEWPMSLISHAHAASGMVRVGLGYRPVADLLTEAKDGDIIVDTFGE